MFFQIVALVQWQSWFTADGSKSSSFSDLWTNFFFRVLHPSATAHASSQASPFQSLLGSFYSSNILYYFHNNNISSRSRPSQIQNWCMRLPWNANHRVVCYIFMWPKWDLWPFDHWLQNMPRFIFFTEFGWGVILDHFWLLSSLPSDPVYLMHPSWEVILGRWWWLFLADFLSDWQATSAPSWRSFS